MNFRYKKIISVLLVFLVLFAFCGFDSENGITSQFGDQKIYTQASFDDIMVQLKVSASNTKNNYDIIQASRTTLRRRCEAKSSFFIYAPKLSRTPPLLKSQFSYIYYTT